MKLKKKAIAILLIAVILSSLIPNLISYAAEPNFTMTVKGGTATTATADIGGNPVEVDIKYTGGMENQEGLSIILKYDPEALEVVPDATNGNLGPRLIAGRSLNNGFASDYSIRMGLVENDKGQTTINISEGIDPIPTSGHVGTVKFNVLKPGSHEISFQAVSYVKFVQNPDDPDNPIETPTNILDLANKFTITSKINPTGIELYDNGTKIDSGFGINRGTTKQLTAKLLPDGATGEVEWSVATASGTNPVSIDQTGKVTANAKGSAIVTAKIKGTNLSTSAYVTVSVPLTGIDIKQGNTSVSSTKVNVNDTITLKADRQPADTTETTGANGTITWSVAEADKDKIELATNDPTAMGQLIGDTLTVKGLKPTTTPVTLTATCGGFTKTVQVTVTNNLNKITLDKPSVGIDKDAGETVVVTATKDPIDTTDTGVIEWSLADNSIAELSSATAGEGNKTSTVTVSGKANGNTKLVATVTKADGTKVTAEIPVTVAAHISAIKITDTDNTTPFENDALNLDKGKSKTLGIKYSPDSFCDERTITWATSDADTVSVENGVITAKKVGVATITATSVNGKNHTITVTVPEVPANALTINGEDTINLIRNDNNEKTKKLTATLGPNNTTDTIEWVSSDPTKVTVDQEGNITAVAVTESTPVTITAKAKTAAGADRGIQDTVTVNVTADLESITLNETNLTLEVGETSTTTLAVTKNPTDASVDVADVVWTSGNTEVATVANGVVTASNNKPGTAVITATLGGKIASCTVKVVAPLTGVEIVDKNTTLELKRKQNTVLTVEYTPTYATDVGTPTWTSSNEAVATVDANGKVIATGAGTATITVNYGKPKDKNGTEIPGSQDMISSRTVKVTEVHADTMDFETLIPLINRKESQVIKLLFTNTDGSDEEITDDIIFESSDPSVLVVDENGKITGIKKGTATIKVTCRNPETGAEIVKSMDVEVKEIPITSLELSAENTTLEEGDTVQINVGCNPKNTTDDKIFTYETSNASIATISSTGLVTAKKAGEVVITVTAQNGVKSQISLTIKEKPQPVQGVAAAPAAAPAVEGLTNSPHTGDMNILGLSVMMIVSLAGIVLVIKKK